MLRGDMARPIKLQFIFRGGMARPINSNWYLEETWSDPLNSNWCLEDACSGPLNYNLFLEETWTEQYFQKNLACTIRGKKHTQRYNFIYWLQRIAAIQTQFFLLIMNIISDFFKIYDPKLIFGLFPLYFLIVAYFFSRNRLLLEMVAFSPFLKLP